MRQITILLLLVILSSKSIQAQDKLPAALQERLITFTDQVWASWMKTGDIRSVSQMRVQETVNDPPCELVRFTDEEVCQQLSKEERADYVQTVDNVTTLMIYRILSRQHVFDWLASLKTVIDSDVSEDSLMKQMSKSASLSVPESSLMKELTGFVKDVDEFRRRSPRYKELESLLQRDHLKDYVEPGNQTRYKENMALLDQAFKDTVAVSKVDRAEIAEGLPDGGEYYVVPSGFFLFVVRMTGDEMRLAFVQTLTK